MTAEKLFAFLRGRREDRGLMANLRCALVESKRHRAWPYLGHLGGIAERRSDKTVQTHFNRTVQTIAGLYATHPEETQEGNIGALCRGLLDEDERKKLANAEGVGPISRRVQHLLAADGDEVFDRIVRFVLRAKAEGIPVNYEQLYKDLLEWEWHADRVRIRWAVSFWAPESEPEETV